MTRFYKKLAPSSSFNITLKCASYAKAGATFLD